jgi:DTW domain-containing protein YfiP
LANGYPLRHESARRILFVITFPRFMNQNQKIEKTRACPDCLRPLDLCVCGKVSPLPTRTRVLILQHPQEKLKLWNSARLANMMLENSVLRVGLSWPNLKKASGLETAQPSKWAALYLKGNRPMEKPFQLLNRKEEPLEDPSFLEGIILLDGSWKQAHSTWWRNPWLLRVNRIALNVEEESRRKQAKTSGLATIESIAHALGHLREDPAVGVELLRNYEDLIVTPNRTGRL